METNVTDQAGTLQIIPIWQVRPSELNPRKQFDQAKLEELAASLKEQGLIEPLVVRPLDPADEAARSETPDVPHRYEIVAGERRFRAAKLAGLTELPCIVREMDDRTTAEAMVVENMQRDDLTPMEEARAFKAYLDADPLASVKGLAQRIGKSDDFIRERMRLLELPEAMQTQVEDGRLPLKVGLMLTRVADKKVREELCELATTEELTPELVRRRLQGTFIDLQNAVFPLNGGSPSCDGCKFRVFRGGSMMLPGLEPGKRDVGVCTNAECFREKLVCHLETKLGAKVVDEASIRKDCKRPHQLWDEKWRKSCEGCAPKLVTLSRYADKQFHRWCADTTAHYHQPDAGRSEEQAAEDKRRQEKEREKQRRRMEQHKLAVPLALDWLDENIGNREGARVVARALCAGMRSEHGKGAAALLGIEEKGGGWDAVGLIKKQVNAEQSSRALLHICAVLTVVLLFGASPSPYNSDLPILDFLKEIGVEAPKVEAKPKKAAKAKAAKAVTA